MIDERRMLQQACGELEEAVRAAFVLSMEGWQQQQKSQEALAWQAAWQNWSATVEAAAASIKAITQPVPAETPAELSDKQTT